MQTERVVLVLCLQNVACGVKRTVVITEGATQNNRFSFKSAVKTQDKTERVGIEAMLA